jgi:hypothetical protein
MGRLRNNEHHPAVGRLTACGIWDLFDPDIEGAGKDGCTHMLLLFSHLPLNNEERRAR